MISVYVRPELVQIEGVFFHEDRYPDSTHEEQYVGFMGLMVFICKLLTPFRETPNAANQ